MSCQIALNTAVNANVVIDGLKDLNIKDDIIGHYADLMLLSGLPSLAYIDAAVPVKFTDVVVHVNVRGAMGARRNQDDRYRPDHNMFTGVAVVFAIGLLIIAIAAVKMRRDAQWRQRRGQIMDLIGQMDNSSVAMGEISQYEQDTDSQVTLVK